MCFMMVLTVMIFWAPLHFLNVYRFYDESIAYKKNFGDLFFVCHIIAVSRSFVNPIIYAWSNARFREGLKYFMCCYCLDKNKKHLKKKQAASDMYRLRSSINFKAKTTSANNSLKGIHASKLITKLYLDLDSPVD